MTLESYRWKKTPGDSPEFHDSAGSSEGRTSEGEFLSDLPHWTPPSMLSLAIWIVAIAYFLSRFLISRFPQSASRVAAGSQGGITNMIFLSSRLFRTMNSGNFVDLPQAGVGGNEPHTGATVPPPSETSEQLKDIQNCVQQLAENFRTALNQQSIELQEHRESISVLTNALRNADSEQVLGAQVGALHADVNELQHHLRSLSPPPPHQPMPPVPEHSACRHRSGSRSSSPMSLSYCPYSEQVPKSRTCQHVRVSSDSEPASSDTFATTVNVGAVDAVSQAGGTGQLAGSLATGDSVNLPLAENDQQDAAPATTPHLPPNAGPQEFFLGTGQNADGQEGQAQPDSTNPNDWHCCMCEEVVAASDCRPCLYVGENGITCSHVMCHTCHQDCVAQQGTQRAYCGCGKACHELAASSHTQSAHHSVAEPPASAPGPGGPSLASAIGDALAAAFVPLQQQNNALLERVISRGSDAPRPVMRGETKVAVPVAEQKDLSKLDKWFVYFNRVTGLLAGGRTMPRHEQVQLLVGAWLTVPVVGEAVKNLQNSDDYIAIEQKSDHEGCWKAVVAKIKMFEISAEAARREAQLSWDRFAWTNTDGYKSFFERLEVTLQDYRHHCPSNVPSEESLLIRVIDLLPPECVRHIKLHRKNDLSWNTLRSLVADYYEVLATYPLASGGGMQRQSAVWDSAKHMLGAPLGAQELGGTQLPASHACKTCHGVGHVQKDCPNIAAAKDTRWAAKKEEVKKQPCSLCQGRGHHQYHHNQVLKQRVAAEVAGKPSQEAVTLPVSETAAGASLSKKQKASLNKLAGQTEDPVAIAALHAAVGAKPKAKAAPKAKASAANGAPKSHLTATGELKPAGSMGTTCMFWRNCQKDPNARPCRHGPEKCPWLHREVKPPAKGGGKGARQRGVAEGEANDQDLFVEQGPTRDGDETCQTMRQTHDANKLVDFDKIDLPPCERPASGYHLGSMIHPLNLPSVSVHVGWDTCAEGTTMSDSCASEILRAQKDLPQGQQRALLNFKRYASPHYFKGFADHGDGIKVDVTAQFQLGIGDFAANDNFPVLKVRIVKGQNDDLLVGWPDLVQLGIDVIRRPGNIIFTHCGVSLPLLKRKQNPHNPKVGSVTMNSMSEVPGVWQLDQQVTVPAQSMALVSMSRPIWEFGAETVHWCSPVVGQMYPGVEVPEGPVSVESNQLSIVVRNVSDEPVDLSPGTALSSSVPLMPDDQDLIVVLDEVNRDASILGTDAYKTAHPVVDPDPDAPPVMDRVPRLGVLQRWVLLVVLVLSGMASSALLSEKVTVRASKTNKSLPPDPSVFDSPQYDNVMSDEYRAAVCAQLDTYRFSRYAHLTGKQFAKLRSRVWSWAPYLHIEGAPSSTLKGPVFDVELLPNVKPVKHTLPKYSEEQKKKEAYHVDKAEKLGHLRTPDYKQLSEWATRTHTVHKKDDDMGRWICDFRDLNRATVKTPIVLSDTHTMVRLLAQKKYKTTFDAWAGFNQVAATERAKRAMQITTSVGIRQWTVMPFGVTNGPSCFQGIMMDHFAPTAAELETVDAALNFFFDDGALGSGAYTDPDVGDDKVNGFDQHLAALDIVFRRAAVINLRFKLSKCHFLQLAVPILGEVAGLGKVSADPAKTDAIRNWPRPSRVEDVERFLCTLCFFRAHVSPKFSDISAPLRECMSELHERRASGSYKKNIRGKDPGVKNRHGDAPDNSWPAFWTKECEAAFNELRECAARAVDLSVPDLEGAANGTNPFILYPDACKYGIGSGLFQAAPVSEELSASHYATMGLPPWSTKAAVESRYQEFKRLYSQHTRNSGRLSDIVNSYNVLSDVPSRAAYDEELGLEKLFKSRIRLVPLGFFSKSLSGAQMNWATWDRELFSIVASIDHFSSIVTGATVVISTDHLNNTVLNLDLKQPDKILRMLLKIHTKIHPVWQFQPGRGQLGDGLSRNPLDRDAVRDVSADVARLPKTLAEAFKMVQSAQSANSLEFDDCDKYTQQFAVHESDDLLHYSPCTSLRLVMDTFLPVVDCRRVGVFSVNDSVPVYDFTLVSMAPVGAAKKDWHPTFYVPCFVMPNAGTTEAVITDVVNSYRIRGPETEMVNVVPFSDGLLQFTLPDAHGSGRWLEPLSAPPWNKEVTKRARLTFLDGVLKVCRLAESVKGVIAFGEACFLVLGAIDENIRLAAYKERHVSDDEQVTLEHFVSDQLHHIVLGAPQTFPVDYLPFLRHYLPEICHVDVGLHQVSIIIPVDDGHTSQCRDIARSVYGSVSVELPWQRPAYRHIPVDLVVETLVPVKTFLPVSSGQKLPTLVIDCMCGAAGLSRECVRFGFTSRAFEKFPEPKGAELPEGDLLRPENRHWCCEQIVQKTVYHVALGPDCSTFSSLSHLTAGLCTRTREMPQGDGLNEREKAGNQTFATALWLCYMCVRSGVSFALEHPSGSKAWQFCLIRELLEKGHVFEIKVDQCAWGKRPSDWNPVQGDIRTRGASIFLSNNPDLQSVGRRCTEVELHSHEHVQGASATGTARSKDKAEYPPAFCRAYAHALYLGWHRGHEPTPVPDLPYLSLSDILANPNISLSQISALKRTKELPVQVASVGAVTQTQRPFSTGGSSSSAGTPAQPAVVPPIVVAADAKKDYWQETPTAWYRWHVEPRRKLYDPEFDLPGGPAVGSVLPTRQTHLVFGNSGAKQEYTDAYDDIGTKRKNFRSCWTGHTVFLKRAVPGSSPALVDPVSGKTVEPESVESLALSLETLRDELKIAQLKDPKFVQIIGVLKKKPAGEFIAESLGPSAELKKAKARAVNFTLADDGLLLGKEESAAVYLPCVPDGRYLGSGRHAKTPFNMTWKHLLLGAVHNTRAAAHLSAADMHQELKKLVYWFPPETLRRDCDTWVERCKHCVSVFRKPKYTPVSKSVLSYRPFHRIQIDLMEIRPTGANGETHILTVLCIATRYPFFRCVKGRDQVHIAEQLLDVFLDAGIVPCIVHSDNEFISVAFKELVVLMGSNQLFSIALRPQSLGADERGHRDIRAGLSVLVDCFIRSKPRDWPKFVRYLESKCRNRINSANISPYQAWHGFSGMAGLASALKAFDELPADIVHTDWLVGIKEECAKISATLEELWNIEAKARARKMSEITSPPPFREGELVLCVKPFYERGVGMILPQSDGPFVVDRVCDEHTCILRDAVSGEPFQKGIRISLARLIAYKYPPNCVLEDNGEPVNTLQIDSLRPGNLLAVERHGRVFICRVIRTFVANAMVEVNMMSVPLTDRFGPWNRRRWDITVDAQGAPQIEVVPQSECLCLVELNEGALSDASLEELALLGVPVGVLPHRDKTIPGRIL